MSVARTASPRVADVAPTLPLPIFCASLIDEEDNHLGIDDGSVTSDEDKKKYFDLTGELKKLNESGASGRSSFWKTHSARQPIRTSVTTSVVTYKSKFHRCPASLLIYA